MLKLAYRGIMDEEVNPLRALPPIVRFQIMATLALLWSSVFTLWIGSTWLLGPSVGAHLLLLIGVLLTTEVFSRAEERNARSHKTVPSEVDGCARYDDVWGATG